MGRPVFEIATTDAAGRVGRLSIPRADLTVETPALLPVVNPHLQLIEPRELATTFGAEILITNAYVFHRSSSYRDRALEDGLHEVLDFPGAIMTDSGSFQLAEYGRIDVDTPEILAFQDAIGSDIATPVDVPTPPDADRETVLADLERTHEAVATATAYDAGDMLLSAPVQGSTAVDLRERAAREVYSFDLDIYPIGAVVPLLTAYRFGDTVDVVAAAKRGLGADAPVHLFGAGHPMMFALAVALGCDLFDSAAYALYARDGRYLTTGGTEAIDELRYLPCSCPICVEHGAAELAAAPRDRRTELLAAHNLHVSFGELRRIKQAIRAGELLELVETRVRSHPDLLDGYRAALDHATQLERAAPVRSDRPFFYVSSESAHRPAVHRHHERLARLPSPETLLLVDVDATDELPTDAPWTGQDGLPRRALPTTVDPDTFDHWWYVMPPFGPFPPELAYTYPLTAERPTRLDAAAYRQAAVGIDRLIDAAQAGHDDGSLERVAFVHEGWPTDVLADLPAAVSHHPATARKQR